MIGGAEIRIAFAEAGIGGLPPNAWERFETYLELLLRWNPRVNLTAIREPEQIIRRHFVECALAAGRIPADVATLLDYGSGAGLPGIAIAICRPEIRVTLSESQQKKAAFLGEVLRVLGLDGEVYAARVEAMPENVCFDAVSMRAVEKMSLAIPVAIRHAKQYLVLLTTSQLATEYHAHAPSFEWQEPFVLPNTEQMIIDIGRRYRTAR